MGFISKRSIDSITIAGETIYGGSITMNIPGGTADPDTGEITIPTSSSSTESKTIDATMLSNKYIVLAAAPANKESTKVEVDGLAPQYYTLDFVVTDDDGGKRLSWNGLGLESLFELGDSFIIRYN